jgi:Protein of unknown function (DUF664)
MKCADLDERQMALRSVPPSTMSLLGILRHMANVEQYWFRTVMAGEKVLKLYSPKRTSTGIGMGQFQIAGLSLTLGSRGRARSPSLSAMCRRSQASESVGSAATAARSRCAKSSCT